MKPFTPFAKRPFDEYFRDIFTEINVSFTEIETESTHLFYVTAPNGNYFFDCSVDVRDTTPFYFLLGSLNARNISDNKYTMEKVLQSLDIQTVTSTVYTKELEIDVKELSFPIFSKPLDSTLSEECYMSGTAVELKEHLKKTLYKQARVSSGDSGNKNYLCV